MEFPAMTDPQIAGLIIFLLPTMIVGALWSAGNQRVNRKAPRTIPMSAPVIIRVR
jgi:hypothetical protein